MHPELVKAFVDEFHREFNRLAANRDVDQDRQIRDLAKVEREIKLIITAIKDGVPALSLKDELAALENKKLKLQQNIEQAPAPMPRLHPNLSELYRQKIDRLHETLNQEDVQSEASEVIRGLIGVELRLFSRYRLKLMINVRTSRLTPRIFTVLPLITSEPPQLSILTK